MRRLQLLATVGALLGALGVSGPGQTEDGAQLAAASSPSFRRDTPSGLPVPRFVSLKASQTYGRLGPSFSHAVQWEIQRRGLPVEVVAETEHWRKVRDPAGDEMWIHHSRLDGRRHGVLRGCAGEGCMVRSAPRGVAREVAVAKDDVIVRLHECDERWCRVRAGSHKGWLERRYVWGLYPGETFN